MGAPNDNFFKEAFKDQTIKRTFRILIVLLTIALSIEIIWYYVDRSKGKHARLLWGASECNIPIPKTDTVVKTIYKTDTIYRQSSGQKKINNNINKVDVLNQ